MARTFMTLPRSTDGQPDLSHLKHRSPWLLFALILFFFTCIVTVNIVQEHGRIDAEERQQLETQATVVDIHLTRSLASVNAALDALRREVVPMQARSGGRALLNQYLHTLVDVLIGTRTLVVVNVDGEITASNQAALIGQNVREKERFRTMRQGAETKTLYVSPPFRSPLDVYAMSVGKVLLDDQGKFAGIVLAILDPAFFKTLMDSVRYSDDMRASVVHGDGKMVFSTDEKLDISEIDLRGSSFFSRHLAGGRELSILSGQAATTRDDRLVALRTIGPDPIAMDKILVIAISRSMPAIFAQWQQRTQIKFSLVGLLALLGMLGLLFHQRRQQSFLRVSAVSERQRIQAEVLANSARFVRTITDAMPGAVAYFDRDLRCQFANKGYQDWYGKSSVSLQGMTLMSLLGEALFAINETHIQAALAGESQQFERFLTKLDGSVGHILANYIPDIDPAGNVLGFIIVVTDIKAFKMAEGELKMTANVFACTSEAIMITDSKENILSVNPAFTRITGYNAEEVVGQTLHLLRSEHHSEEFHTAMWQQVNDSGMWQGETWSRKKTGAAYLKWKTITKIAGALASEDRYVAVFRDITETWKAQESIKHQAFHDALTKLPNRSLLMERINRQIVFAERAAHSMTIMFLDLDRFKAVNDRLGHAAGDDLLVIVAEKLQGLLRETDTVARLGGDEFVILLDHPASRTEVEGIASRIIAVVKEPVVIEGTAVHIGTSVGIAVYPADGTSAEQLIKCADLAMYAAKCAGRNVFRFFTDNQTVAGKGEV
ncbi:MAG: diguanylate cyclase (GGDEF)-like protein/PAS domain S-box-containing protein [Bradyrhizobium sp.]|jgi:diguanylate cyclase (GGDEF)-like protein/PAS domain S-box-containing protein